MKKKKIIIITFLLLIIATCSVMGIFATEKKDTTAPQVDISTLQFSEFKKRVGGAVSFTIKVSDESEITEGYFGIDQPLGCTSMYYDAEKSLIKMGYDNERAGTYRFYYILIGDEYGNKTIVINSAHPDAAKIASYHTNDNIIYADLSAFTYTVNATEYEEIELDLDSMYIEDISVNLNERTRFFVKAKDGNDGFLLKCYFENNNPNYEHIAVVEPPTTYNDEEQAYVFLLSENIYGVYNLMYMYASDGNGHITYYVDNSYKDRIDEFPQRPYTYDNLVYTNLSRISYEVSAEDPNTGIEIYSDVLGDDIVFNVEPLDDQSEHFDILHEKGDETVGFYDVHLEGKYTDDTHKDVKISFPVNELDGTQLTIKHLEDNGNIEEKDVTVHDGQISMKVKGFSPFMISKEGAELEKEPSDEPGDIASPDNPKAWGNKGLVIVIIVVVILAAVGTFLYLKKRKDKSNTENK